MKKIIILTIVLSCLLISCGKKGDPVYNESKNKIITSYINIKKA